MAVSLRLFFRVHDLAQAFKVKSGQNINGLHDLVDRNNLLAGKTRDAQIDFARGYSSQSQSVLNYRFVGLHSCHCV